MNDFAPVIIFVYNRLLHTRKTLEALNENRGVEESTLYIYSDGPKNLTDEFKVKSVRNYIEEFKKICNFKRVTIIKGKENRGLANSVIQATGAVINKYGRSIILEDDLITSEDFLVYMNQALDYYENNDLIWAISGYTPDLPTLKKYDLDVYFSYRASSWGWATWKDRWQKVDWNLKSYNDIYFQYHLCRNLLRGGNDLPSMLRAQSKGKIDSWAVRWVYFQCRNNKLCVYPRNTKIQNIGFDNSGTHSKASDSEKYTNTFSERKYIYNFNDVNINKKIIREFACVYHLTLKVRIRDKIMEFKSKFKMG